MADFVELGLQAADHLLENHFDKIPDEVFHPREALHNIRHRHQKHSKLDQIEERPGRPPSPSSRGTSPTLPNSSDYRRISKEDFDEKENEEVYEGNEKDSLGNKKVDRSRSGRRREREDPFYREAEKRTQNPRDYDPECLEKDPYSPRNPYWATQKHYPYPLTTVPASPSSSSLKAAHPADAPFSTQQRSPTSTITGTPSAYAQENTSRDQFPHTPGPASSPGYKYSYNTKRQFSPPANSSVTRGAPSPRYDIRSPNPPPNVNPYYPVQQQRSPSPVLPPATTSMTYATSAYVPYPYPTAAAAAAAFGAERPWEYEYDPTSGPPRSRMSRSRSRSGSRSRSRSRHRSHHRHPHQHRRRRRDHRPSAPRRASSTGDTPDRDLASRSRSTRNRDRPGARRRASSTGDVSSGRTASRRRDFGLPSKLSSSDRALGAGGAGAIAGGFLAQEVGSLLHKSGSKGRRGSGSGSGSGKPLVLTLLGAVVGGLGANLLASREERRLEGERASVRGWMDDVRGERRAAMRGWKADEDRDEERERERDEHRDRDRRRRGGDAERDGRW